LFCDAFGIVYHQENQLSPRRFVAAKCDRVGLGEVVDLRDSAETIARLNKAIREAKAAYQESKLEFRRALEVSADVGLTHPDGSSSNITAALRREMEARSNYVKALNDLTLHLLRKKITRR
jgi:hypothetical protein